MPNNNICIGIDLGTTKSAIAWGRIDENEAIEPQIIQIPMLTTDGTIDKRDLLPSCVYFPRQDDPRLDIKPIVGEYATGLTGDDLEWVRRSIKLKMGQQEPIVTDGEGKDYNPVDISRLILEKLKESADDMLFRNIDFPKDVAIAYPASFEEQMVEATRQAAEDAGFKKFRLVEEPIAALWKYWEDYCQGRIGKRFDLDKPKLWLVFDLGGGTLDVVLYAAYTKNGEDNLKIYKIETGRFTAIGGDKFDEKVATFLLNEYKQDLPSKAYKECNDDILKIEFQLYAELAKCELTYQSEQWKKYREDELNSEEIIAEILQSPDGDKLWRYELSLCKYKELVARYLAETEGLEKLETSFNYYDDSQPPENIIASILDVLKKGQEKLRRHQKQLNSISNCSNIFWDNAEFYQGKTEPGSVLTPDIVLLNGSMTRSPVIPERLERFFGFPPAKVPDPEISVACGAAIWMIREPWKS